MNIQWRGMTKIGWRAQDAGFDSAIDERHAKHKIALKRGNGRREKRSDMTKRDERKKERKKRKNNLNDTWRLSAFLSPDDMMNTPDQNTWRLSRHDMNERTKRNEFSFRPSHFLRLRTFTPFLISLQRFIFYWTAGWTGPPFCWGNSAWLSLHACFFSLLVWGLMGVEDCWYWRLASLVWIERSVFLHCFGMERGGYLSMGGFFFFESFGSRAIAFGEELSNGGR